MMSFMFLALAGAAASQAGQPDTPPDAVSVETVTVTLDIHPAIAPAIFPYVSCLTGSKGVPMRNERGEVISDIEKGTDCAPYRARAVSQSHRALKRAGFKSSEEREAVIGRTLSSVEAAMKPPAANDIMKSPENAQN